VKTQNIKITYAKCAMAAKTGTASWREYANSLEFVSTLAGDTPKYLAR
jgi:hypothetical protein